MTDSPPAPEISVIVPAHAASSTIEACLRPLLRQRDHSVEVIVVDDRSSDDGPAIARRLGAQVVANLDGAGPAAARNTGARLAGGTILFFLDADVVAGEDAIERVRASFRASPDVHAIFGSYDEEPAAREFVSQYRNLLHHFIHQSSDLSSRSFWAGCGAIRADVFRAVGGFDAARFPAPSIEDIDLGRRLSLAGYTIRLERTLQVKHLKRWTWPGMISTDVRRRAYPWSRMILQGGSVPNDLNLRPAHRVSTALVGFTCLALGALLAIIVAGLGAPAVYLVLATLMSAAAGLVALNWRFYAFLRDRRGWAFALRAMPVHWLYYLYAGLTFGWCWLEHRIRPGRQPAVERLR